MYAARWKHKLLKHYKVKFLPLSLIHNEDVLKDIDRTYPTIEWFKKHKNEISNIVLNFVEINPALSYMQGMCFMVFTLFYVYRHSDFRECETLYSLHKLIEPIRPIYPLDTNDGQPLEFVKNITKLILLNIHKENKELSKKLKEYNIVNIFVVSGFPSFFGNWYDLEGTIKLFDSLISEKPTEILRNMIDFMTYFFIFHKDVIFTGTYDQIMYVLQQKGNLSNILLLMKTKKRN